MVRIFEGIVNRPDTTYGVLMKQADVVSTLPGIIMVIRAAKIAHATRRLTDREYADVLNALDYRAVLIETRGKSTSFFSRLRRS